MFGRDWGPGWEGDVWRGGLGLNEQERRDVSIGDIAFFLIYDFYRVCFFWKVLEELIFTDFWGDWWPGCFGGVVGGIVRMGL